MFLNKVASSGVAQCTHRCSQRPHNQNVRCKNDEKFRWYFYYVVPVQMWVSIVSRPKQMATTTHNSHVKNSHIERWWFGCEIVYLFVFKLWSRDTLTKQPISMYGHVTARHKLFDFGFGWCVCVILKFWNRYEYRKWNRRWRFRSISENGMTIKSNIDFLI